MSSDVLLFDSDRSPRSHNVRPSVCLSVCPFGGMLFKALNFHHSNNQLHAIFKQSVRNESSLSEHSVSTQWALKEHSESNQRALWAFKKESIQSEPKILCLVKKEWVYQQLYVNFLWTLALGPLYQSVTDIIILLVSVGL